MAQSDPDISQLLGRIDGKLDQVIETFKEHREDDVRRFTDVYQRIDSHSSEINKAHGAKSALLWAAGIVASLGGAAGAYAAKKLFGG